MYVATSKTYYAVPECEPLSLNRVLEGRNGLRVTLFGLLGTTTALEYFVTIQDMACLCNSRIATWYRTFNGLRRIRSSPNRGPPLGLEGVMMRRKVYD